MKCFAVVFTTVAALTAHESFAFAPLSVSRTRDSHALQAAAQGEDPYEAARLRMMEKKLRQAEEQAVAEAEEQLRLQRDMEAKTHYEEEKSRRQAEAELKQLEEEEAKLALEYEAKLKWENRVALEKAKAEEKKREQEAVWERARARSLKGKA